MWALISNQHFLSISSLSRKTNLLGKTEGETAGKIWQNLAKQSFEAILIEKHTTTTTTTPIITLKKIILIVLINSLRYPFFFILRSLT